jgi:hypothetical protein
LAYGGYQGESTLCFPLLSHRLKNITDNLHLSSVGSHYSDLCLPEEVVLGSPLPLRERPALSQVEGDKVRGKVKSHARQGRKEDQMKTLLLLLSCLVSSVGCATGPMAKLPPIDASARSGEVTVIRASSIVDITNSLLLTLDGKEIFGIRSGQYTKFTVNEGNHVIGVKCFGGWTPTWKEDTRPVKVKTGESHYLLVSPDLSCAGIEPVNEAEGQRRAKDSEYVSMGQ